MTPEKLQTSQNFISWSDLTEKLHQKKGIEVDQLPSEVQNVLSRAYQLRLSVHRRQASFDDWLKFAGDLDDNFFAEWGGLIIFVAENTEAGWVSQKARHLGGRKKPSRGRRGRA